MAKTYSSYTGALNGKLGHSVGYTYNGYNCLRSWVKPHNPRTKRQQCGRKVFGAVSSLASKFRGVSHIGLRGEAEARSITETSLFISLNRKCVSIVDEVPVIDYAALTVADGDLPPVQFGEARIEGGNTVGVDYAPIPGRGGCYSDYVYLALYSPAARLCYLSLPTARSGNHVAIGFDSMMAAGEMHLYGFTWDNGLRASQSTYLGCITI